MTGGAAAAEEPPVVKALLDSAALNTVARPTYSSIEAGSDGTIRVRWKIRGDVVEVEVTDGGGATVPKPAPRTVWLSSGRGLRIVRSMAHEWGVTEDRTGNVVWATLGGPSRRRAT